MLCKRAFAFDVWQLQCQSEGGNGLLKCPGRDRDMDLCWDRAVVQTSWPLKINHAGLMPRALSEWKSGLEVRRTMSEITWRPVWARGPKSKNNGLDFHF